MDRDPEQTRQMAQALTRGREKAGNPSWRDIERQLLRRLEDDVPAPESIRRLHLGEVPATSANVILVVALVEAYGMNEGELPPTLRGRINRARELLISQSACTGYTSDGTNKNVTVRDIRGPRRARKEIPAPRANRAEPQRILAATG